jgi:hypothetical protein
MFGEYRTSAHAGLDFRINCEARTADEVIGKATSEYPDNASLNGKEFMLIHIQQIYASASYIVQKETAIRQRKTAEANADNAGTYPGHGKGYGQREIGESALKLR